MTPPAKSKFLSDRSILVADKVDFSAPSEETLRAKRLFFRLPMERINWVTSFFLIGTLTLTLTAVPVYLWFFGLDWFQVALFFTMLMACGFSVTLGYHRLFSHMTFQASWPIRLFTLIFGEGYHNYHHEFQYDYRNGVKPWQMDPTKWIIWTLSKLGLVRGLRRVAEQKILTAEQATRAALRTSRTKPPNASRRTARTS